MELAELTCPGLDRTVQRKYNQGRMWHMIRAKEEERFMENTTFQCKTCILMCSLLFFFEKDFIYLFLERGKGREKGREVGRERNTTLVAPRTHPNRGPGPQPKHVP